MKDQFQIHSKFVETSLQAELLFLFLMQNNFCLSYKTRIIALFATMFLQTWNGFEIDPSWDNNHIRQKIIDD